MRRFYSNAEEGIDDGFFDGQMIEAETESEAWKELKLMLTEEEFKTAEML